MREAIATNTVTEDRSPAARRLASVIAVLSLGVVVLSFILALRHAALTGDTTKFLSHQALLPFASAIYLALGVLIIRQQPQNAIGWIFLGVGALYSMTALAAGLGTYGTELPLNVPPWMFDVAAWLDIWAWVPAQFLPTTFLLLLFPDGHLPSRRWRPVAWSAAAGLVLIVLGLALHPGPLDQWATGANPFGVPALEPVAEAALWAGSVLTAIGVVGSLAAVVFRFRRSEGVQRQQMKWLAYAALVIVIFLLLLTPLWYLLRDNPLAQEFGIAATTLAMIGIAVAATIAIVRHGLYDIDLVINRTLVYGALTAASLLIYGLVVGLASALFQTQSNWLVALLATGLVAILFSPLRERLQRWINRMIYGQRDEPFEVLAQLGQRLENSVSPDAVYPTIVETIGQTLRLPYTAIELRRGGEYVRTESYGVFQPDLIAFPLTAQGEEVGRLLVAPRSPGEALTPADSRLLRTVARQAAAAVRDVQLTNDLRRSRQELVTSREEERRRLRRDLHDGLGPSLASLLLEARVLKRLIDEDPVAAAALVDEMQEDIRTTIDDIRRVVHELRPPALDDLGLVPALQLLAARVSRGKGSAANDLMVVVDAPDDLPSLPAAVEVAAYRIIQEALANVVHHANARRATVLLSLDGALCIEISDDGRGFVAGRKGGLGLLSMRERAEELGGQWSIAAAPGRGTLVQVRLPFAEDNES